MSEAKPLEAGGLVLLALAFVCWVVLLVCLLPAGRSVGWTAVIGAAAAMWLLLGAVVWRAAAPGSVVALYVVSMGGAAASFYAMSRLSVAWTAAIPILLPPLMALRARLGAGRGSLTAGCAIALLSLAPLPALVSGRASEAARIEDPGLRARTANLARIRAMPPDAPLSAWYSLLEEDSGVREEALAVLRRVPRRQADLEDMLTRDVPLAMVLLPQLDLEPTAGLCAAARGNLERSASGLRIEPPRPPEPYTGQGYVMNAVTAIRWLQANGCDCAKDIVALESAVETHLDSPARQRVLAALDEVAQK